MPSKHRNKRSKQRGRLPKEERGAHEAFEYIEDEVSEETVAGEELPVSAPVIPDGSPAPAQAIPDTPERVSAPAVPEAPAAAEAPVSAEHVELPRQESAPSYRPPVYTADTARRSARPSDAEVREFLDAFKRGDFLNLAETEVSNPPVQPDERF